MINVTLWIGKPVLFRNPLIPCVSKSFAFVLVESE